MKKYILKIILLSVVASGVFIYLYFSETSTLPNVAENLDIFLWNILAVNVIGWWLSFLSHKLNAVFSWKSAFAKRYFSGLIISLAGSYLICLLFAWLYLLLPYHTISLKSITSENIDLIYKVIILYGFLLFLYTLIDFAVFSYRQYAYEQIAGIQQTSQRLTLQLSALKKQLSPHFLFNSLNTASSLIYRDEATAEQFIRKLANSYHKILDSVYYNLIPLSKELDIVEAYKYLMEIRYERALKIDINIPEKYLRSSIPPLSLQLLVENAVKHNLINDDKPLYIEIYHDGGDYLTVANNLNNKNYYINLNNALIKNPEIKSSGVGLENIKNRYAFFSTKPVHIEKKECFKVQLPVLKNYTEEDSSFFNKKHLQALV